jgi:tRNA(Ile)-lysidine synthase
MIDINKSLLYQNVKKYIARNDLIWSNDKLLVAVSGGIDSMTMLVILKYLSNTLNLELIVAHFNHLLRGLESDKDAQFVAEVSRKLSLKYYIGKGDINKLSKEWKMTIEEAARTARYNFLTKVMNDHDISTLAVAHNSNDNAETLIFNLLRGSGVTGLAGIPPIRIFNENKRIIRPFLSVPREEIESFAKDYEIKWREDETNELLNATRNKIRHELLPELQKYNSSIVKTLNSTTEIMRGVDDFLGRSVDSAIKNLLQEKEPGRISLKISHLKYFPKTIQSEIIQKVICEEFNVQPIDYATTERILLLLSKETGCQVDIVSGISGLRDRDNLVFLGKAIVRVSDKQNGIKLEKNIGTKTEITNKNIVEKNTINEHFKGKNNHKNNINNKVTQQVKIESNLLNNNSNKIDKSNVISNEKPQLIKSDTKIITPISDTKSNKLKGKQLQKSVLLVTSEPDNNSNVNKIDKNLKNQIIVKQKIDNSSKRKIELENLGKKINQKNKIPIVQNKVENNIDNKTKNQINSKPILKTNADLKNLDKINNLKPVKEKTNILNSKKSIVNEKIISEKKDANLELKVDILKSYPKLIQFENINIHINKLAKKNVKFEDNKDIEFVDAKNIMGDLILRKWQKGDKFIPLGMSGEKKLSDFFVDIKIPLDKKGQIMVLVNKGNDREEIIWICGFRIANKFRITRDTKHALKLEMERTIKGKVQPKNLLNKTEKDDEILKK